MIKSKKLFYLLISTALVTNFYPNLQAMERDNANKLFGDDFTALNMAKKFNDDERQLWENISIIAEQYGLEKVDVSDKIKGVNGVMISIDNFKDHLKDRLELDKKQPTDITEALDTATNQCDISQAIENIKTINSIINPILQSQTPRESPLIRVSSSNKLTTLKLPNLPNPIQAIRNKKLKRDLKKKREAKKLRQQKRYKGS